MKYKGIIFDLDGVICSTDECHYQAWKKLADEIGAAGFNREDNARQRGVSRMESLEVVLEKAPHQYTQEEKAALAEHKNEMYRQLLANMSPADLTMQIIADMYIVFGRKNGKICRQFLDFDRLSFRI